MKTHDVPEGVATTITNEAGRPVWPVIRARGPFTRVEIENRTALDEFGHAPRIVFDARMPGALEIAAGDYLEIDTAEQTIRLNGDRASAVSAGMVPTETDFWFLGEGENEIVVTGCDAEVVF